MAFRCLERTGRGSTESRLFIACFIAYSICAFVGDTQATDPVAYCSAMPGIDLKVSLQKPLPLIRSVD